MVKKEKVTREDLEQIGIGESETFELPKAEACETAKSLAYKYGYILNCRFSAVTDYKNNRLTLTKYLP